MFDRRAHSSGPLVVVSAHAADFVWRAGGFIASRVASGGDAHVLCLSFGERGESQGAWKNPDMTVERAKLLRRSEADAAGEVLGAEMTYLDAGDYPLPTSEELVMALVEQFRRLKPSVILTHAITDPYNTDHTLAADLTLKARMIAQAAGHQSEYPPLGAPQVFRFEPHQPEMCDFRPDVLVDITSCFATKEAAMKCMVAQEHLWHYYTGLAERRGVQAVRNGGAGDIRYAEAYQRVFPQVTGDLC